MKVITTKPIIYSNADDGADKTAKQPKQINPDVLKTGGDVLTGIGTALVNRQRQYTDAEQRCGKRPLNKKAREAWQKCVDSNVAVQAPIESNPIINESKDTKKTMSKGLKIGLIAGSIILVGVISFILYKKSK